MLQFLVGEDMRRFYMLALLVVCSLAAPICNGAEVQEVTEYGVRVFVLQQDRTVVKVAPSAGLNAYSISVDGVEFLHQPESKEKLAGVSCGVPILYPTPNRVRGGKFSFGEGRSVCSAKWSRQSHSRTCKSSCMASGNRGSGLRQGDTDMQC